MPLFIMYKVNKILLKQPKKYYLKSIKLFDINFICNNLNKYLSKNLLNNTNTKIYLFLILVIIMDTYAIS